MDYMHFIIKCHLYSNVSFKLNDYKRFRGGFMGKKVYGTDKRLDFAVIKINREKKILDEYLIKGVLDSIYLILENEIE